MATEKQIEANRANALKSTGPKTPEGKNRARLNACRHNLTGQVTLMPEEDRAASNKFCAGYIASLNPANDVERQLAQVIARDNWRLNRAHAMEDNILALGHSGPAAEMEAEHPEIHAAVTAARVFSADPHQFQLLTLYIQRTNRDIHRNMQLLRTLQAERRATRAAELQEASALKRLAEIKGETWDPQSEAETRAMVAGDPIPADLPPQQQPATGIGFVFSTKEIDAWTDQQRRRKQANWAAFYGWDAEKFLASVHSEAA